MKSRFEQDAGRWEDGELSLSELQTRHPDMDVPHLTQLWWRLASFAETPTPDPAAGWGVLRAQLPERSPRRDRLRRFRRSLVAAAAAAMLGGTSIAYAAGVEPVRREKNQIVRGVTRLFGGNGHGSGDGTYHPDPRPGIPDRIGQKTTRPSQEEGGSDQSGSHQGGQENSGPNQPGASQ